MKSETMIDRAVSRLYDEGAEEEVFGSNIALRERKG
jgi:hypothetical protein